MMGNQKRRRNPQQRSPLREDGDDFWAIMEDEDVHTHLKEQEWKVAGLIGTARRNSPAMSSGSPDSLHCETETPRQLQAY